MTEIRTLLDACRAVLSNKTLTSAYPNGLNASDVLAEIRKMFGDDAFPLASVLDVANEMRSFYGTPRRS